MIGADRKPCTRVLVTGHRGRVGRGLVRSLRAAGYAAVGFDLSDGDDIRDRDAVFRAVASVDVVVHAAALATQSSGSAEELQRTNVEGSRNVVEAASAAGHGRLVVFSSAQVLGCSLGDGLPETFPIRDDHPLRPTNSYAASKAELEELCETVSTREGLTTVCLRPFHVWQPGQAADNRRNWQRQPSRQWEPYWEFGTFIDIRDLSDAVLSALSIEMAPGTHLRALLCSPDIAALSPSREMAARLAPTVPFQPGWADGDEAWQALADCKVARERLGWNPRFTFAAESRKSLAARGLRRLRDMAR